MGIFDKMFRKKIIICIHGLANKPEKKLLEQWCKTSIREGFKTIEKQGTPFTLKLVYWADLMYEKPQDPNETDKKSDSYFDDPYVPGNPDDYKDFKPSNMKQKVLDKVEKKLDAMYFKEDSFINFDKFANIMVRRLFKDLDLYYHKDCPVIRYRGLLARDAIRMRLAEVLRKYHRRDILLVAHSMGTIISYDVLTHTTPDVPIHTLITIGSPLAMPLIMKQILIEQGRDFKKEQKPVTPESITTAWYNYADLDDPVAIIYKIGDDYRPNSRGVSPKDTIIYNNYEIDGDRSPHKLYGYLRAPEVARAIYNFCTSGRSPFFMSVSQKIRGIFGK
ncbi:MAG: hypothetical protein KA369_19445 [Spirochaetes bacterium]|nr:hypothetical protein [Spirochaetota bacterium]